MNDCEHDFRLCRDVRTQLYWRCYFCETTSGPESWQDDLTNTHDTRFFLKGRLVSEEAYKTWEAAINSKLGRLLCE